MRRTLLAVAFLTLVSPSRAAPHEPAAAAERETAAIFDQAWGGDEHAYKHLRKLADAGNVQAQNGIGNFYADGKFVPKDEAEALKWWTKAAEQGFREAQYNVAQARLRAIRHDDDMVKVNEWLLKAAEQGLLEAQIDLGVSYTMKGTPWFDAVQAYKWLTVGVANAVVQGPNGQEDQFALIATNNLVRLSKTMKKEQIVEAEKLARTWLEEYGISLQRELRELDAFNARLKAAKP
jgi:TPR repeat protein